VSEEQALPWSRAGDPRSGFVYLRADGKPLRLKYALERIRSLAIPPAWTEVRIAADPQAKIQAVGRDAAGRLQYRYHADHVALSHTRKYRKLLAFARALPRLREATNLHLRQEGVGREKVLATVVRLMNRAFFRIGSERYAVVNRTFGIATLRKSHLEIRGNDLIFRYVGKGSADQRRVVADTPLVEIIEELRRLPGERLFRYRDADGNICDVTAREVNAYIKEILGESYSSKDMRTWGGTVRAATVLADLGPAPNLREAKRNVVMMYQLVSSELGNTPAVCRSAYVHPVVPDRYLEGETIAPLMRSTPRAVEAEAPLSYYPEEAALLRFLERHRE
jgi:DNA topoisomerase I